MDRLAKQLQRITKRVFYFDSAVYLRTPDNPSYDDYGQITDDDEEIPIGDCSYNDKPNKEDWKDFADVEEINGEIRFTSPTPRKGDAIKVTARWSELSFEDVTFEIIGIRDRGTFGYAVALKKVQL